MASIGTGKTSENKLVVILYLIRKIEIGYIRFKYRSVTFKYTIFPYIQYKILNADGCLKVLLYKSGNVCTIFICMCLAQNKYTCSTVIENAKLLKIKLQIIKVIEICKILQLSSRLNCRKFNGNSCKNVKPPLPLKHSPTST